MSYFELAKEKAEKLKTKKDVLILGIESSCDETSISIVKNGREILSNVISSQIEIHTRFGGVVPEVASRNHVTAISNVLDSALEQAGVTLKDIDAIAVTKGVGLIGALFVGVNFAKSLAYSLKLPLFAVNHIKGHIASNYIAFPELVPPFMCLVISGGHTSLFEISDYTNQILIGQTLDDAVGEAFDKVAREVGLDYPGGPIVDRLAKEGEDTYGLPYPLDDNSYNFSFSGIKSAVVNLAHNEKQRGNEIRVADMCTSFQNRVVSVLTKKTKRALKEYDVTNLIVAGGVAANNGLRESLINMCEENNIKLSFPELRLCTDNAAMIGAAAYYAYKKGIRADLMLNAKAIDSLYKGTDLND